jgi:hypothetical protein
MYYAIHTRFFPATETRGARIRATLGKHHATIPYPYELTGGTCHRAAAEALQAKLRTTHNTGGWYPWDRPFVSGELLDGSWTHVFLA